MRSGASELTDEALVAGMAVGDDACTVAFVRRFQRRVFGLAFAMIGDREAAEEVAQEAFWRAWRHAGAFDRRRGAVSTWLLAITRNVAIDSLRVRRPVPAPPADVAWAEIADPGAPLDERASAEDGRRRLMAVLNEVPESQARAVVLAVVYGFSAQEVSDAEGVPLGTAKARIRRGLIKLRALSAAQEGPWRQEDLSQ
ncbi:MAG TPA: sigma-70 family RNA polymerase sigma factor [Acidimicrobiales bacterium]|nr:sigma-70 family RNA polymerase sigma factor [Acidimicrobiales bacterium]